MKLGTWRWVVPASVLLVLAGCGADAGEPAIRPEGPGPAVIRVPQQAPSINAAVGAARPGDLVLVSPGVYRESVRITTPGLVLRGADRNRVVIDGEVRRSHGVEVTAAGVAVENLTVRNHLLNGVLFTGMHEAGGGVARGSAGYERLDPAKFPPLRGFAARYVTAANNGLYGIYAFDAQHGVIEHSYASGHADSGIYVGQCKPCDIVVRGNVAERNAVGYEGTNASGKLYVLANRFSANRVGLAVGSDYQEAFVPQEDSQIVGNLVAGNAEARTPEQAEGGFGIGIGLAGGRDNVVSRNRISGNPRAGLVIASSEDLPPVGNRVVDNVFASNGTDVADTASERAPGSGNCLRGNRLRTTAPEALATMTRCGGGKRTAGVRLVAESAPVGIAFSEVPLPPHQPQLPRAATRPPTPAAGLPGDVDVDAVPLPGPDLLADRILRR